MSATSTSVVGYHCRVLGISEGQMRQSRGADALRIFSRTSGSFCATFNFRTIETDALGAGNDGSYVLLRFCSTVGLFRLFVRRNAMALQPFHLVGKCKSRRRSSP